MVEFDWPINQLSRHGAPEQFINRKVEQNIEMLDVNTRAKLEIPLATVIYSIRRHPPIFHFLGCSAPPVKTQ